MKKEICDNCGKEINWKNQGFFHGRIHYHKGGFFKSKNIDYDFCSLECFKEILLKEKIINKIEELEKDER